jgi:rubredoxin
MHRLICCDCGYRFYEEDAEEVTDSLGDLQDGELVFIECLCPNCGSDDLEDIENLKALREMKAGA